MPTNQVNPAALTAALATPEEGVVKPARVRPASVTTQLSALRVGECWSRVVPVLEGQSVGEFCETNIAMRDQLRSQVHSSLRHAKFATGGEYTVETASIIGASGGLYIGCIVRRVS